MADSVGGPRTSRQVTIEDAALYDGDLARLLRVAGQVDAAGPVLRVQAANGEWLPVRHGQVVVLFGIDDHGVRDLGVMSRGEWDRYFGEGSGHGN